MFGRIRSQALNSLCQVNGIDRCQTFFDRTRHAGSGSANDCEQTQASGRSLFLPGVLQSLQSRFCAQTSRPTTTPDTRPPFACRFKTPPPHASASLTTSPAIDGLSCTFLFCENAITPKASTLSCLGPFQPRIASAIQEVAD